MAVAIAAPAAEAARAPARYLVAAQNDDGGCGGAPGQSSSQLYTGWTAIGLAAAGRNPRDVGSPSAIGYIRDHADELNDLGEINRTIIVLAAAGLEPRLGDRDLVAEVAAKQRRNGSFADRVNTTAFAVLGLRAAGRGRGSRAVRRAADWIAGEANRDGGFNFAGQGGPSGIDDTGAAVQALAAAGRRRSGIVKRAARFIVRNQASDGGFALIPGGPSNAQSTAWAIQGLLAAGRNPAKVRRNSTRDPLSYLRSLTAEDGSVRYSRTSRQTPVWVTGQALAALSRKTLPLARVPRARRSASATQGGGGSTAEDRGAAGGGVVTDGGAAGAGGTAGQGGAAGAGGEARNAGGSGPNDDAVRRRFGHAATAAAGGDGRAEPPGGRRSRGERARRGRGYGRADRVCRADVTDAARSTPAPMIRRARVTPHPTLSYTFPRR